MRNRQDFQFPPGLHPLVYDKLQYLQNQDAMVKENKDNIQAVKELYIRRS